MVIAASATTTRNESAPMADFICSMAVRTRVSSAAAHDSPRESTKIAVSRPGSLRNSSLSQPAIP